MRCAEAESGEDRLYFCIDMKCFFASAECAERGKNPFTTPLVVADVTRGSNALCLAVSPYLKAQGVRNRCRLSDIPKTLSYEIAPPRMAMYIRYAADIYELYLQYFSPQDIHVYSIDESFLDITPYRRIYRQPAHELAEKLLSEIAEKLAIPASCGMGTNLYLAKVALDLLAKRRPDHIAFLDPPTYRSSLAHYRPLTDFWQISTGTAARLFRYGVADMEGIRNLPEELLYKVFGKDAELLIDHAWGREDCRMEDIKNYKSRSRSVSFSQILPRDYRADEARIVLQEMVYNGCLELRRRHVVAARIGIYVAYSREVRPPAAAGVSMLEVTALPDIMLPYVFRMYDREVDPRYPVRRLGLSFEKVVDENCESYHLLTDWEALGRQKKREEVLGNLCERYGKNILLRGVQYVEGATQRERNRLIGGHRAGEVPKEEEV